MKNLSKAIALAGVMSVSTAAMADDHASAVDVSMSAGVATTYLFRGIDQQVGSGMVYGDLVASAGGAYGGVWVTSGVGGGEYDLFVGYGGEAGDFSYDINVTSYVYTGGSEANDTEAADFSEVIASVGYQDFGLSVASNITGDGYDYVAASYSVDKIGVTAGFNLGDDDDTDYTHVDVSYAYNDNLTFIASKIVDIDDGFDINGLNGNDNGENTDVIFVVDVALPF
jgi:uncharacterized protein (TIGR02001 family)